MKREKKRLVKKISIVIASIVFVGGIYIYIMNEQQRKETTTYLYEISQKESSIILQQMTSDFNFLRDVQNNIENKKDISEIVNEVKENNFFDIIIYFNHQYYSINNKINNNTNLNLTEISDGVTQEIEIENKMCYLYSVSFSLQEQEGKIIGIKESKFINKITDTNIFNKEGYSQIISNQGNIIIRSNHKNSNKIVDNIFDVQYKNEEEKNKVKNDLLNNKNGITNIVYDKDQIKKVMVYIPIGISDLYVATFISEKIINAEYIKIIFLTIILIISVAFTIIQFLLFINKEREKSKKEILKLAYQDPLTKGYNKNKFMIELNQKKETKDYAIVILNIKNFKHINEIFGREFGNQFLIHINQKIKEELKKEEIYARAKDDVFYLLIKKEEIESRINKIVKQIKEYTKVKEVNYYLEVIVGIYRIQKEDEKKEIEKLIDKAILAMEQKKEINYYNSKIEENIKNKYEIEKRMEQALINKEFVLYIQPKYETESEKIVGGEVLVRWKTENKMMYPDQFISIFEENNFIKKLDLYLLEKTGLLIKKWKERKYPIKKVSVNQSVKNIFDPNYSNEVKKIINQNQIPVEMLEIELTENIFVENEKQIITIEKQLHQLGISIAMDDFGKGYSTYDLLERIDIDVLKLDKKLIDPIAQEIKAKKIIKAIIHMAKELNITVVAEGVETKEQLEILKAIKCDQVQGYYFSKPITIKEFEELIKKNNESN